MCYRFPLGIRRQKPFTERAILIVIGAICDKVTNKFSYCRNNPRKIISRVNQYDLPSRCNTAAGSFGIVRRVGRPVVLVVHEWMAQIDNYTV